MTKTIIGDPLYLPDGTFMPLSRAVKANGFIFTSGQLGLDDAGQLVEGGIEAQTRQTIDNLAAILKQADASLDDVVKATVWLTDKQNFREFNRVYAEYFKHPPGRSTVVSDLMSPGALVEIEVVAVCP